MAGKGAGAEAGEQQAGAVEKDDEEHEARHRRAAWLGQGVWGRGWRSDRGHRRWSWDMVQLESSAPRRQRQGVCAETSVPRHGGEEGNADVGNWRVVPA